MIAVACQSASPIDQPSSTNSGATSSSTPSQAQLTIAPASHSKRVDPSAGISVTVQGGVIGDIPDGAIVSGYPARSHREYLRAQAALYRLAKIVDDLEALVRRDRDA